jgi:aldose sugar dehydrogenase
MSAVSHRWLLVLILLLAGIATFLVTETALNPTVGAFSAGPPPGYTRAPGEEPEACAECHVSSGNTGSGQISITAPSTYVPGQTYQITVTHTNSDPTRLRWGFELTALDTSDEKAGELHNINPALTQIIAGGPGGGRQYIEHTAGGTFINQTGGASWTFNWTAPSTDVGVVTFYAAGNQANNDGNTSGDFIYFTFASSQPAAAAPDFSVNITPSSRVILQGAAPTYDVEITPIAGFTGNVNLFLNSVLPAGSSANFNPSTITITDANPKTSVLTIATGPSSPPGTYEVRVLAIGNDMPKYASSNLIIADPMSANLSIVQTASPNPGVAGTTLTYRLVVSNSGPASATNVAVVDNLPSGVTFGSVSTTQGACGGTGPVNCAIGTLSNGASAIITIAVTNPTAAGQITNNASVTATEADPDISNNSSSLVTVIDTPPPSPILLDQNLSVKTIVSGLDQPTTMTFLGPNEFLVLERATGRVQRVKNGELQPVALDLAVNNNSERGLLGIALHPNFPAARFVYLYWTESATGLDTSDVAQVNLLGNRVDRYRWDGSTLTFDRNLIKLRAFQEDEGATPGSIIRRGNHNGGIIRFGPDGKLYIVIGDNGRRGFLQNITTAVGPGGKDDAWGGPEPDDAHLTGAIIRLNDDGTTPVDNPFYAANSGLSGTAAENIKKVYAYGIRNSFGMAFDPLSGNLWTQENGDDAFDELNRVVSGFNGGWTQIMGPSSRIAEYKSIESTYGNGTLQQLRWPPSSIADTPAQALARVYALPGSQYIEPQFSWKYALAPSPIGFVQGNGLGPQFNGDLLVGASRATLYGGFLFRFKLANDRLSLALNDSRLQDKVADNLDKFDVTESESLMIGKNFGVTTDIQTGPDGNLYVVSLSNGAVYQIAGKQPTLFTATLTGAQEVPPNNSTAVGTATLLLSPDEQTARVSLNFSGLSSAESAAHIHGPAVPGVAAPVLFPLPNGNLSDFVVGLSATDVQNLKNGLLYINAHSSNFPNGEIRGQFGASASASSFQFGSASLNVAETAGTIAVTVTRSGSTASPASVNYTVSGGTAVSASDFVAGSGTLSFAAGETFKTFSVSIVDDLYVEGNETVNLSLSAPSSGAFLGSPNSATLTIFNNDNISALPPQLVLEESGPAPNQAVALDSFILLRDPFPIQSIEPWFNSGADTNTRVIIFSPDLRLNSGELASSVVVNLVDANNQSFDIPAEDVRLVTNAEFTQITFRLPDSLANGTCTMRIKAHALVSSPGTFRIIP